MTEHSPEEITTDDIPEGLHELYFVQRDGDSGLAVSSSDDMTETGPPQGWPDPPMLRVTKDFYERWESSNAEAASKVPADFGLIIMPTAADVLEPYTY